jgi:hypothetical protein
MFAQFAFPKASLAVLEAFTSLTGIELDLTELSEQAKEVQQKLGEMLSRFERVIQQGMPAEEEEGFQPEQADEGRISAEDERHVEQLFREARQDRSKAYALKQELDRLGVFRDYEDRFLDLFKKPE